MKDLSTRKDILTGNDWACLRFQKICIYIYLHRKFREHLWSPPPYLKIRHIRLRKGFATRCAELESGQLNHI